MHWTRGFVRRVSWMSRLAPKSSLQPFVRAAQGCQCVGRSDMECVMWSGGTEIDRLRACTPDFTHITKSINSDSESNES